MIHHHHLDRIINELNTSILSTVQINLDNPNPVAIFATLLSYLDQLDNNVNQSLIDAALTLFAQTCLTVPRPIIKAKHDTILQILIQTLETNLKSVSTVRCTLKCMDQVFNALDVSCWQGPGLVVNSSMRAILSLCVDSRPPVRKYGNSTIRQLLSTPLPPKPYHPMCKYLGTSLTQTLTEQSSISPPNIDLILQVLQSIAQWAPFFPDIVVEPIVDVLLGRIPFMNVPKLTTLVYTIYRHIASRKESCWDASKVMPFMQALVSIKPNIDDHILYTPWLLAYASVIELLNRTNPSLCSAKFCMFVVDHLFPSFQATHSSVYTNTSQILCRLIDQCIPKLMVDQAIVNTTNGITSDLELIIRACESGLSVRYQHAWAHVLAVLAMLVRKCGPCAASLMRSTIKLLDHFHSQPDFTHHQDLDAFFATAIEYMGPSALLSIVPLNIDMAGLSGVNVRTYLLPLMADHVQRTSLAYFCTAMIPLAQYLRERIRFYENKSATTTSSTNIEYKVHEALYLQVWSLLPGFCTYPTDLVAAFQEIGPVMGTLLTDEPNLRPIICTALHHLITKLQSLAKLATDTDLPIELQHVGYTIESVRLDMECMRQSANYFMPLLFNMYKDMHSDTRDYVAHLIEAFVGISSLSVVQPLFNKVMDMLQLSSQMDPSTLYSILDLVSLLVPGLDQGALECLFGFITQALPIQVYRKKCYKMLNQMCSSEIGMVVLQSRHQVLHQLVVIEGSMSADYGALKYRLQFISHVLGTLIVPSSDLAPILVPELMEAVKDVNHVTRGLAMDVAVKLARAIGQHTGIDSFLAVIAAGLVSESVQFVSATVLVLARLCFEFKDEISIEVVANLLHSIMMLTGLRNREVCKSVFKFIKTLLACIPPPTMQVHLSKIVECILDLGDGYGSEFRVSVRHMLQRLCRTYGIHVVDPIVPEQHKRLIMNIRKRNDRAKRRKEDDDNTNLDRGQDERGSSGMKKPRPNTGYTSAFDSVVYGDSSDSEIEQQMDIGGGAGQRDSQRGRGVARNGRSGVPLFIAEHEDSVVDFLDKQSVSQVLASKPQACKSRIEQKRAKLINEYAHDRQGRVIISDKQSSALVQGASVSVPMEEDYYKQSITSKEGYIRQGRKIKFGQQLLGRGDEMETTQIAEGEEEEEVKDQPAKLGGNRDVRWDGRCKKGHVVARRNHHHQPGREYRAKKAGGDIKRKGLPDPFAYIPLSLQMAGKRRNKSICRVLKQSVGGKRK